MMDGSITDNDEILEEIKELFWQFDWVHTQKHLTGIANKLGSWTGEEHVEKCNKVREIVDKV